MSLTILSVAYPLAPVGRDACGGAEQVLAALDRALSAAGHRSIVVAQEGSEVTGVLASVPRRVRRLSDAVREACWPAHAEAIRTALRRWPVDLVHMHGLDFCSYLPPPGPPVLATLHLPPSWHPCEALRPTRPDTWINCVSMAAHRDCPKGPALLPPIENGVPVAALGPTRHAKRSFALFLGRICPEKGVHLAVEAAKRAGISLLVAGEVYPYEAHERYFAEEVAPALDPQRRFIGPVGFARKRRLLSAARCVLIPSLAAETSSLVAREAAACGTPVVAFPSGALGETIEHGRTGFLVDDVQAMADAIRACGGIDPEACRRTARRRFSLEAMTSRYLALYAELARSRRPEPLAASA